MLDFLKKDNSTPDVKALRQNLLLFIKDQLKKYEGGEGSNIKGLQLFLAPPPDDRDLYETVVYLSEGKKFKEEEVQRIADDFALELPHDYGFDLLFVESLPTEAVKAKDLPVALHVSTKKQPVLTAQTKAFLSVVNGEAEQKIYELSDKGGKVCIGREKKVQTPEGFLRENNIAFPSTSFNAANKFVSRQHAHVEWNRDAGAFFLYADEGGIPPKNKIKVQTRSGDVIRLQSTLVGHHLQEGDQIVLGQSALLQFSYEA